MAFRFDCPSCPESFPVIDDAAHHLRRMHPGVPLPSPWPGSFIPAARIVRYLSACRACGARIERVGEPCPPLCPSCA